MVSAWEPAVSKTVITGVGWLVGDIKIELITIGTAVNLLTFRKLGSHFAWLPA